jgi:hypothetical protein
MRRHVALLGIGIAVAVAAVVFFAPAARGALLTPAMSTGSLPLEKQWRFVVATAGTFQGKSGYSILLTGDGVFGGASGLSGGGTFSIYKGPPVGVPHPVTIATGTWKATTFVHFQGWGGNNQRAFGGQLTMKTDVQVDDGPHFTGGNVVVTCLIGHPPAGMQEGVTVSGNGVNFNTPIAGVTLFSMPSFQVDNDLAGSPAHLIAMINRQSLGACNLGCC